MRKKTTAEFIEDANKIHGEGTYDYSLVEYETNSKKVKIICNECKKIDVNIFLNKLQVII